MRDPWKVVVDRGGVTISSDQFQLTTNSSDPNRLDTVISELQSVTRTTYGQYCGLSRAIEMVGERWGLLIVRDLLVSAKTATELHRGLPLIPTTLLAMRLREMTYCGVLRTVAAPEPGGQELYELTEYGRALEDIVLALGRWGAMTLGQPRPEDIITVDSLMTALRATFQADAAREMQLSFELHVADIVAYAMVDHGRLVVDRRPISGVDAVIDPGLLLKPLLTGEISAEEALAGEQVIVVGDPALLARFVEVFHLTPVPA